MKKLRNSAELIETFFLLGGNHEKDKLKKLQVKLKSCAPDDENIAQIIDILILFKMYEASYKYNDFDTSQAIVKPILSRLMNTDSWNLYDIRILVRVIGYPKTYKDAHELAQKALSLLEQYVDHERYHHIKRSIHFNISYRLLRARYFDIELVEDEDIAELDKLFNEHIEKALSMCKEKDLKLEEAALLIRRGVYEKDYDLIDANLETIKQFGERAAHKMMQDEVNDYNAYVGDAISAKQFNVMIGRNIKKLRELRCMTQRELARRVDLAPITLNHIEIGHRSAASHKLFLISHALNVKVDSLYNRDEKNSNFDIELEIERQKIHAVISSLDAEDVKTFSKFFKKVDGLLRQEV